MSNQAQQAREAFGARLRDLRKDAGLTGRALARLAGWQLSKVSKIEHGKQNAKDADIRTWCHHTGAEDQIPELIAAARNIDAMWLEWRRVLQTGTKLRQQQSLSLYRKTRLFRVYHPEIVWGTLQTAEYAAAILNHVVSLTEVPDDDIDAGVAARMQRQQFLYQGDRRFHVLLGEQALCTNIGGLDVMHGQLDRLLAVLSLSRLSLGIIPLRAPYHVWPENTFIMFDDRMVMVETYSAELTITQPREIALYARAFALLQRSAVYGRDARDLIGKALAELR